MTTAGPIAPAPGGRRLLGDRSAVSTIEFAIAGPIVLILICLVLEMGFLLTGGIFLEIGARAAARAGITGGTGSGSTSATRDAMIRQIITRYVCPSSLAGSTHPICFWTTQGGVPLQNGSPLVLTMLAYTDLRNIGVAEPYSDTKPANGHYDSGETFTDVNGNGKWDADMGTASAGGSGDLVVYTAKVPQMVYNPLLKAVVGGSVLWHTATLVVRNEPY
jgi:hypothetical protein